MSIQKVAKNVYVETDTRGAKHGIVVTKQGLVMVDTPQYPKDAVAWRDAIAKYGTVRYIIHTEPHADHWGGDYFWPEADIIAHEGTREEQLKPGADAWPREAIKSQGQDSIPFMPPDFHYRIANITISERMTLYMGKHTIQKIGRAHV